MILLRHFKSPSLSGVDAHLDCQQGVSVAMVDFTATETPEKRRMTHEREIQFSKSLTGLLPSAKAFAKSLLGHGRPCSSLYEDFAQDAIMKAWQHRHCLTAGSNLKAWLFAVIRNAVVSHYRRHWREVITENAIEQHVKDDTANPEQAAVVKDVYRKFDLLAEMHRQALLEIAWAGLSYGEAAELRGIALGTMKSRVSRARQVLAIISGSDEFREKREAKCRRAPRVSGSCNDTANNIRSLTKSAIQI